MKIEESAGGREAKVNIVAQEIRFAKLLAGNEANVSFKEKQLRKLKKWLKNRASASFCKLKLSVLYTTIELLLMDSQLMSLCFGLSRYCSIHKRGLFAAVERSVLLHVDVRQTVAAGEFGQSIGVTHPCVWQSKNQHSILWDVLENNVQRMDHHRSVAHWQIHDVGASCDPWDVCGTEIEELGRGFIEAIRGTVEGHRVGQQRTERIVHAFHGNLFGRSG